MHKNNLVSFITHYGPIAAQDNLYDENIHRQRKNFEVSPIEVEPSILEELSRNFQSPSPRNVILTGTAGDGKTFHCRALYQKLGGCDEAWARGEKQISLSLVPHNIKLTIVKDLSELTTEDKEELLPRIAAAAENVTEERFLVAANDGQLLSTWRSFLTKNPAHTRLFESIETLLVENIVSSDTFSLDLYNLSKRLDREMVESLLTALLEHEGWHQCEGCPAIGRCSIRENRERLQDSSRYSLRIRLVELIYLASFLDRHVTIRQLLVLITNILLGVSGWSKPLITCRKIQQNPPHKKDTNPYDLVFGINLKGRGREQHEVFNALSSYGIGEETTNSVDDLLVFGAMDQPEFYRGQVGNDPLFGAPLYKDSLANYLEGERENLREFLSDLVSQRRRLFFEFGSDKVEHSATRWELTIFNFAESYLELIRSLEQAQMPEPQLLDRLLRGLNRTFTGLMIDTGREVFFTTAGGDGASRVAPYVRHTVGRQNRRSTCFIQVELHEKKGLPIVSVHDLAPNTRDGFDRIAFLELGLGHFEYLLRVSDGALPFSFSRQCFEDFRDFQLKVIEILEQRILNEFVQGFPAVSEDSTELKYLEIHPRGEVNVKSVEVSLR